jgi:hypothetical protein
MAERCELGIPKKLVAFLGNKILQSMRFHCQPGLDVITAINTMPFRVVPFRHSTRLLAIQRLARYLLRHSSFRFLRTR